MFHDHSLSEIKIIVEQTISDFTDLIKLKYATKKSGKSQIFNVMKKEVKRIKWFSLLLLIFLFSNCQHTAKSQQTDNSPSPSDKKAKKIQIALLLDTSNSMDGLIDQAKAQLWTIVNELAKAKCDNTNAELQIALYEYGNNNLPASEGFIRMVTPLTTDLDQISKDLFSLTTNGGDEFCGNVIQTALKQLSWSPSSDDLQLIYIAGNEPFTQGSVNYVPVCQNAKEKHVIVNTIFCGNFEEGISTSWKKGADITGGNYASIEQNKKTVYIESPYDDKITKLNSLLNDTYIPYGKTGYEKKENQIIQDENAQRYGSVNFAKRAVSKSSGAYKNSSWDLVDASKDKNFSFEELEAEELPEEMKEMTTSERKIFIEKKKEERNKINREIQALSDKRAEYVAQKQAESGNDNMLDKAILTSLRKQAKSRNFVID